MYVSFVKMKLIILAISLIILAGCSSSPYTDEQRTALANCLADKGVTESGAFWCPNCHEQKKLFGDAFKILEERGAYIECDARGDNAQPERCIENDIQGYPTWDFPDESRLVGIVQLETLAGKTGCPL